MNNPILPAEKEGEKISPKPTFFELTRDLLREKTSVRFQARGFSMDPFIRDGDVLTIAPFNGSKPKRGDVVAFAPARGGKLTIHRVIGKKGKGYLIKGDNMAIVDGLIPEENLLGKVKKVERKGKDIVLGLGREKSLIALLSRGNILIPLLIQTQKLINPLLKKERIKT